MVYSSAMTFFKRDKKMDNHFENKGGEQNIAQGPNAIGKQVNIEGVPPELFAKYVEELGVTKSALTSFFKILEQEQVPSWELDSKLREFACQYKEFKLRLQVISSDDPQVKALKKQAEQAFISGRFSEVEGLLNQIDERCDKAILQLHKIQAETAARLEKEQLGKAENLVSRAKLQRLQYRYEKSAQYFQEAAAALPEGHEWERATYLGVAGYDLHHLADYSKALECSKQSLILFRAINDRNEEAKLLNNISLIYQAQGAYDHALDCLEQCLHIWQVIGNKQGQGATLNNIATLAYAKGDYAKALKYFEQNLPMLREIQDREGEGGTLNNIGMIHDAQGDYAAALQYYKQALAIAQEIKDKRLESVVLNNISQVYHAQKNYDAALEYAEQDLAITRQIGDRQGEGTSLNNIGKIYEAKGDCPAALKQYEQALGIAEEIGNKDGEANWSVNISWLYANQGELVKAESYLHRAVELMEQLERPDLEKWSKVLEAVRAKLREQQ